MELLDGFGRLSFGIPRRPQYNEHHFLVPIGVNGLRYSAGLVIRF